LTGGVREASEPTWQCPAETDGAGWLCLLDWAEAEPCWAGRGKKWPTVIFPISILFPIK
jgi:hypothetical protein